MASSGNGSVCTLNIPEVQARQNIEYWSERYKARCLEWHIDDVHPHLLKYLSLLTQQSQGVEQKSEKKLKFFLPLCGKTKDIPFLLNLGFEVFGVEAVDSVIQEFIQENKDIQVTYDSSRLLYHTADERLKIYYGDLFKCPIEEYGPFDCVWDRASFIALDYGFRPNYMNVMKRSVAAGTKGKHDFRYLLQSVRYDKSGYGGPPRCVDANDIEDYFKSWAKVTRLETYAVPDDHPCRQVCRGSYDGEFDEEFYLIEPKE